jgi:hypothetical protein
VHAPDSPASFSISDSAPQGGRAVADAGRWAALTLCLSLAKNRQTQLPA